MWERGFEFFPLFLFSGVAFFLQLLLFNSFQRLIHETEMSLCQKQCYLLSRLRSSYSRLSRYPSRSLRSSYRLEESRRSSYLLLSRSLSRSLVLVRSRSRSMALSIAGARGLSRVPRRSSYSRGGLPEVLSRSGRSGGASRRRSLSRERERARGMGTSISSSYSSHSSV